jgi:hypothetical protein
MIAASPVVLISPSDSIERFPESNALKPLGVLLAF